MLGTQRPLLELSAGRKLVVQAGVRLEVVRDQRNTVGRQIGAKIGANRHLISVESGR
jgi:hypothetical protein